MKLTITELAKKAGVSVATISRATNPETREKVAKKTLKKIDALIEKYGYTPNLAAKNLRKTITHTIGVVVPYFSGIFYNSYYVDIFSGVSDYLLNTDYQFKTLLLKEEKTKWDNYDFRWGERVDGLIVCHWPMFFSSKSVVENINVPCVVINDLDRNIKTQFFAGDHISGGQIAAEHLYSKGHRNFAVLVGPPWSKDSRYRLQGFQDYLKSKGIEIPADHILRADYRDDLAYEIIGKLLEKDKNITAVFCCNDNMAFGVLRRLREMNLSCPGDVSVVGYDNDPRTGNSRPSLTTISVPCYEIAKEGAKCLIHHLQNGTSTEPLVGHTLFPVSLVERKSVREA